MSRSHRPPPATIPMATLETGAKAPHFTLTGTDGRSYSLAAALSRGPVLAVFFKTTCPACDLAFPYLNRLAEAYPGDRWQLWAISQDPLDKARPFAQRLQLAFPVLLDEDGYRVSRAYDPPATPTLFFIDSDGNLLFTSHGFNKDDLNRLSGIVGRHLGVEARVIAERGDGRPDFRPG